MARYRPTRKKQSQSRKRKVSSRVVKSKTPLTDEISTIEKAIDTEKENLVCEEDIGNLYTSDFPTEFFESENCTEPCSFEESDSESNSEEIVQSVEQNSFEKRVRDFLQKELGLANLVFSEFGLNEKELRLVCHFKKTNK